MTDRSFTGRKRIRKSYGRIPDVTPMPNLAFKRFFNLFSRLKIFRNAGH
jgi:hypothetical protein